MSDAPGSFAEFTGQPLTTDLDVIGKPTADVTVSAPTFAAATPGGGAPAELVLFFKLYDLKPDGTIVLAHRLVAPVRIADFTHPVHVEIPGIVHRFAKGDRIALTIAASDAAYRGNNVSGPVTISTDPAHPGVLTLPVVAADRQLPITATPLLPAVGPAAPCVDRRKFSFRVHQPKHGRVTGIRVYLNGKLLHKGRGHRIARVTIRRLPKGIFTLKIVALTNKHSRTVSTRVYRGCAKSRPKTKVHRHRHRRR